MIEDLGLKDATDFNDIVVDIVSTYTYKMTTSDSGITTFSDEKLKSRKAEIMALGGTLNFELNIGGTTWKKSDNFNPGDMINTEAPDYNKVLHTITLPLSFDPATNNISVTVYQEDSDKVSNVVNFPADGAVPMIFAIDPFANWATERAGFEFGRYVRQ